MKPTEQEILTEFGNVFREDGVDGNRQVLEITWFRNILYYCGEQWLSWFSEQGTFGRRYELNISEPTPVSNIIRDYVRAMKALILNKTYTTRVWPNSLEQKDKDAASLAEYVLQWMNSLRNGEIYDVKELIALWTVLTGNGFARTYPAIDMGMYVADTNGKTVVGKGDVAVECVIPFNVSVAPLGIFLNEKRYIAIKSLKCKEWVEDTFNIKIGESANDVQAVDYQQQLMTLVANVSPWKGRGLETDMLLMPKEEMVVFKEIEYRPTKAFPKGRYVAIAGDTVVRNDEKMPIPIGRNGEWHYSLTHFSYNATPGGFWAISGVDDLISPQNTINEVDQDLKANRKSVGRPFVLTPDNLVLKRMSGAGQSFLQLAYNAQDSGGLKPEVHRGTPFPQQVLDERRINKEVAQEAAGDPKNILRGQSPHSGASGVMVDILREAAEASHGPDIDRFYRAWNRIDIKRLIIAQKLFTEKRLLKIKGEGEEVLVKAFRGSDLNNNTDVRLELDAGMSTTHAGRNQLIMNLVQYGFWGNMDEKPQLRDELTRRMGIAAFPEQENLHKDRASRENSIIINGRDVSKIAFPDVPVTDDAGEPMLDPDTNEPMTISPTYDPLFAIDPDDIHIAIHDKVIFGKEFPTLSEKVQTLLLAHREMHLAKIQAAAQQQQVAAERQMQMEAEAKAAAQTHPELKKEGTGETGEGTEEEQELYEGPTE